jgi:spore coat polysaccharide biosynthesis protein SpsF
MITNIVTVIQTRTGSTRLPNKVLFPLAGKPLFVRMVERVRAAKLSGLVVIATTSNPEDDLIEDYCFKEKINCFRGHPTDLVDRHYKIALTYNAQAIVKIPSDCPLIDPKVIDKVISYYIVNHKDYDFVSNLHPATYPDGNDVEIMSIYSLKEAWLRAKKDFEREHTTPYIWDNPNLFRIGNVEWETGLDFSMTYRWTLDYMEDYEFISAVFNELYYPRLLFGISDILCLLERRPELKKINEKYLGVNWYRNNLQNLKTIKPDQTKLIEA